MLRTVVDPLVSLFYPQACHVCGRPVEAINDGVACSQCWASTRIFNGDQSLCQKCGALLSAANGEVMTDCRQCGDARYDAALATGIYERALAAAIVALKKKPHLSKRCRQLLVNVVQGIPGNRQTVVIPVPLSKRRKLERGYNQAEILADIVARSTGFPLQTISLIRTGHSPIHRAAMDKKAREMTVASAFEVRSPRLVEGRDVILVDDVFTSGSTASYCAKALKKKGAGKVTVVTLARAVW